MMAIRREVNILHMLHAAGCGGCLVKPLAIVRRYSDDEGRLKARGWALRAARAAREAAWSASRPLLTLAQLLRRSPPCLAQPLFGYVMPASAHGSLATLLHRTCHRYKAWEGYSSGIAPPAAHPPTRPPTLPLAPALPLAPPPCRRLIPEDTFTSLFTPAKSAGAGGQGAGAGWHLQVAGCVLLLLPPCGCLRLPQGGAHPLISAYCPTPAALQPSTRRRCARCRASTPQTCATAAATCALAAA